MSKNYLTNKEFENLRERIKKYWEMYQKDPNTPKDISEVDFALNLINDNYYLIKKMFADYENGMY